jgi:hypothetical protein
MVEHCFGASKMKLSIIMPAIRSDKWQKVYDSIQLDFPWELIIVAPYDNHTLPRHNVKYIQDFGSPVRASCIGANLANGKYLTWIADLIAEKKFNSYE